MSKKIFMIVVICTMFQIHDAFASNKYALVIGNRQYEEAPLRNPENDANDMAALLKQFGFSVIKKINIGHQDMEDAIRNFGTRLQEGDIALFYFSGHGLQVDGMNYLLPIGSRIESVDEIKYKAVNANMVLDKLEQAGSQVNIIILDACRNNPFSRFRSLQRGLALMSSPSGTLIAYATSPGNVAYDGDERNSPYTKHLLKAMKTPGFQIEEVFKDVRVAVMAETEKKQVPWESSSLTGKFYFIEPEPSTSLSQGGGRKLLTISPPWLREGTGTWVKQTSHGIEITLLSTAKDSSNGIFKGGYLGTCQLVGDFDIQVDYVLLEYPEYNGVRVGLAVGGGTVERSSDENKGDVYVTNLNGDITFMPTNDKSGTLRITRKADTLEGYYFDKSLNDWKKINSRNINAQDTLFSISAWSHDSSFNNKTVKIAFEDLILNYGKLQCP